MWRYWYAHVAVTIATKMCGLFCRASNRPHIALSSFSCLWELLGHVEAQTEQRACVTAEQRARSNTHIDRQQTHRKRIYPWRGLAVSKVSRSSRALITCCCLTFIFLFCFIDNNTPEATININNILQKHLYIYLFTSQPESVIFDFWHGARLCFFLSVCFSRSASQLCWKKSR